MFKIGDRVKWRYTRHGNHMLKGCIIINVVEGNAPRYKVRDFDNQNVVGRDVETWVDKHHIEIHLSEHRDMKLKELGI